MVNGESNSLALQLLVSSDLRLRILRHGILWLTAFALIYRGFHVLSTSIPHPSLTSINRYTLLSTALFGSLTVGAYWLITTLTQRFILGQFRIGLFIGGVLAVHIVTAELVLAHFWIFIRFLTLADLPRFYSLYSDHIKSLSIWQAPVDSIIVWLFSFSLVYNYLLYAVALKVFKDLFTTNLRQIDLERENLRLEFDFLKAQMNPHFLFNTLNNIYSFSVRSPEKVANTVLKLADLMRYTLYETSEERVPLSKEIAFLTSYVDLQRIRHDEHVSIRFSVSGQPTNQQIPPLLLIVFVENAFKHGIQSNSQASWVDIQVSITVESFHFQVINSIPHRIELYPGGIGLSNVRKRLQYLYPHGYKLIIQPQKTQFSIYLTLSLDEPNLPSHRTGR